jgi:hypothetical protein
LVLKIWEVVIKTNSLTYNTLKILENKKAPSLGLSLSKQSIKTKALLR